MNAETLVNELLETEHDAHVKAWERVQKWDNVHNSYRDLHKLYKRRHELQNEMGTAIGYERALARAGLTKEEVAGYIYGADLKGSKDYPWTRPVKRCSVDCGAVNQATDAENCSECGGDLVSAEAPIPLRLLNGKYARYMVGVHTQDGRTVYFREMVPPKGQFE